MLVVAAYTVDSSVAVLSASGLLATPVLPTGLAVLGLGLGLGLALPIGRTVVVTLTSVVTEPTGQLVTVGLHEVIVYVLVTSMVLVVYPSGMAAVIVGLGDEPPAVMGQTVVPTEITSVVT